MGLNPEIVFGTESKGWVGDNPLIHLNTTKIESMGWKPRFTIEEGVRDTVQFLSSNPDLFR
jgi:UDP-glucose 4-epimerase